MGKKWKPADNERFWYVHFPDCGDSDNPLEVKYNFAHYDLKGDKYQFSKNVFRSKREALEAAKKIREILR